MEIFINFLLLGIIYVFYFYRKWKKKSKFQFFLYSLMYLYISLVLYVTIMPFPIPFNSINNLLYHSINLIPFRDLIMHYDGALREVVLNVIMMVPFGFLFPLIKQRGFFITVFTTFFFSLMIETSQLLGVWWGSLYSRSFDVTDLITNTFGGIIGYFIFLLTKRLIYKIFPFYLNNSTIKI